MTKKLTLACLAFLTITAAALGAEGGEHRELIQPEVSEMIWSLVTFLLFFAILSVLVWPKILKSLQAREGKIKGDLQQAEESAKAATAKLAEYQAKLAAAQVEAMKIMDQGRAEAQRLADSIKTQAQDEITATRKRAEADIRTAKEQALAEIYATTATLATDVASKIIRRQITAQDQQQLVSESLAELGKAGRG